MSSQPTWASSTSDNVGDSEMCDKGSRVEVRLYGKLRRFASQQKASADSIVHVPVSPGDTIESVLERTGIRLAETSNLFLNGELSSPVRSVRAGDRLGVFPDDQALLYKWYFEKKE